MIFLTIIGTVADFCRLRHHAVFMYKFSQSRNIADIVINYLRVLENQRVLRSTVYKVGKKLATNATEMFVYLLSLCRKITAYPNDRLN
jgi:hypothetical protein